MQVVVQRESVSHSVMSNSGIAWTAARQVPLSIRFSRQEYWSGWPFPSLADLPNPGIEPGSPALQADSLPSELQIPCTEESGGLQSMGSQ